MKSSVAYYFLMKISVGLLIVGFVYFLITVSANPQYTDEGGHLWTTEEKVKTFGMLCVFLGAMGYLAWNFGIVDCDPKGIEVRKNGKKKIVEWSDVSSVNQMPFCTPPVYRIAFSNGDSAVYVIVFSLMVISVGFWSWDGTGFKDYVQSQIDFKPSPNSEQDASLNSRLRRS